MKKVFFFLVFFNALYFGHAQDIMLRGTVKDSIGNTVEMANVVSINVSTKKLESYGITNFKGAYKLNLKVGSTYNIKVSYLGFKSTSFSISPHKDTNKNIVIYSETSNLDEVELVYEMPVTVRGDTIIYNTDSFVSGTEKKLKDVLENLPGVEVNDDGQIEVEGKTVSKVMVEGKDFFDGDSKLAVENIPANALSKIEILKNYNEVSQMKGLSNDNDNVAINIRLKEGKKNFWFGEVTAGYGPENRFLAHPKLFYYSPELSINIITDLNNVGEVPFTRRDYRNFTGGFKSLSSRGGGNISTGSDALSLSNLQNNKAKDIDTKFAALNFGYSATKSLEISGFGIYSYTGTLMQSLKKNTFISSNDIEEAATNTDQTISLGMAKLSAKYTPNSDLQLDYDLLLKQSNDNESVETLSVATITDQIRETKKQKPLSFNQNINGYFTKNEKNIFVFKAQHLYQDEDPFYNVVRNEFVFLDLIPVNEDQSIYNLNQSKNTITNKVDATLDYYYVLNSKSNLNLTVGSSLSHQKFNSGIYQILDNSTVFPIEGENNNNNVTYKVSDVYAALHYKVIAGIFTFNPGLTLHKFKATNTQLNTEVLDNITSLLPDVYINAQLKKSENLRFNYRVNRSFTDINKFAEAYVLNNYNSIYAGNRALESALSHNLSLNFFSFNMFNFTNIFGNISYSKRIDALKSSTEIIGINSVSSTINSNFEDESISANGKYERTFNKIKASFRGNIAWSSTNNLIDNKQRTSESFTQNYTLALGTNFKDAPNVELGYRYTVNNYDNGGLASTFYTNKPYVRFDVAFLKEFIFTLDYDHYKYTDKENTIDNKYSFLEAYLSYQKKESKWEFGIKGTNLLNTASLNKDNSTDLYFSTQSYLVQPRYVLFTVKYNL